MCNLKLWSLLLPIVLIDLQYKKVIFAAKNPYFPIDNLFGGFIGCLWQNVCLDTEICVDDSLFGKCKSKNEVVHFSRSWLTKTKVEELENVLKQFSKDEIDWRDLKLQCVIRSILNSKDALEIETFEELCGLTSAIQRQEDSLDSPIENPIPESYLFSRPMRSITRKLKRFEVDYESEPSYVVDLDPKPEAVNFDRMGLETLDADAQQEQQRQHLREQFDREMRRIIFQLTKAQQQQAEQQHRPQKYAARNVPQTDDRLLSREKLERLSEGRTATDWSKRLNQQQKGETLKRRYQLRLPDDLQPLPQRTRSWVWTKFYRRSLNTYEAEQFLKELFYRLHLASPIPTFHLDKTGTVLYFQVPATTGTTAEAVADALRKGKGDFEGFHAEQVGFGRGTPLFPPVEDVVAPKNYTATLVVCLSILAVVVFLFLAYTVQVCRRKLQQRRDQRSGLKTALIKSDRQGVSPANSSTPSKNFLRKIQGLFDRHTNPEKMKFNKTSSQIVSETCQPPPMKENMGQPLGNATDYRYSRDTILSDVSSFTEHKRKSTIEHKDSLASQTSSNCSWSSEPVSCGLDVTTGHLILSYMETYLREDSRMNADWEAVNAYEAEEATPCVDAQKPENLMRNRLIAPLPYEQSRVRLRSTVNDYINASLIYDHSPRNPVYIATPTPLTETLSDFWQMVWEQCSVVLVCLERPAELKQPENDLSDNETIDACIQYWPVEGTRVYGNFEVHLVSEHSSCDKYIVRSFYLKNLESAETRTVTQFHYLTWNDEKLKSEAKSILEFRRKVNRSFRGMMSPIVVHCQDGSGRTGTYILLDLVLSRITKGVKEINIAATLEHLRDQRQNMVQTKEQYEFVFSAVAHEVDAMLKMSNQNG